MSEEDAPFIVALLNEPSFLEMIGDRGVRTIDDARAYLRNGPIASYARHGFGLLLVSLRDGTPIGICGVLKRDTLEDPDLGYAYRPLHWGQGFAQEAAAAVLQQVERTLGLHRVVAITKPDNHASNRVLERLGFRFDRLMKVGDASQESRFFVREGAPAS